MVLCRNKQPLELTSDHKPSRDDEKARIEELGGFVSTSDNAGYVSRVNGSLAVSRSVGDIFLKEPVQFVSPVPEINQHLLTPDDDFMVLASDGLFDVLHNREVVDSIRFHKKSKDDVNIGEILAKKAIKYGSGDNITVVIVNFIWTVNVKDV